MNIGGKQVSLIVLISAFFSTVAIVGGGVTDFANTFGGSVGHVVSTIITGVGLASLAFTAFVHTMDTAAGQPAPAAPSVVTPPAP